jgi:solute:Na+ symporter, SSS family
MAAIDAIIVLAFVAYAIAAGWRSRAVASRNLDEYFLAGRSLPGWKAGISMAATQFAADTPLLVTGLVATAGIFALWRLWIYALAFLVMGFLLAPSWRRARVLTDAELTELRYGARPAAILRAVKAIYFGVVFNCTVLAWVLLAATRIAEPFLPWHQWLPASLHGVFVGVAAWIGTPLTVVDGAAALGPEVWVRSADNLISIVVILTVVGFYSTTGGLRSVVNTDLVQFGLMITGTFLFAWIAVERAGGLVEMPDAVAARYAGGGPGGITADELLAFTPSVARHAPLALLAVVAIQWIAQMNADGTGYLAQRTMACRTDRDARQAAVVFTVAQILVRSLLWIPLAIALLLIFPPAPGLSGEALRAEREASYVVGMAELLPAGALGIMVTAMLAALASTVDTHLNWGSSYFTNDLYRRFWCRAWRRTEPDPRTLVWVARGANLLILAISLALMTRLGSIATAWQTSLLLGAGMGGVLLLRWLWWRVTAWAELGAILASLALAPALLFGVTAAGDHTVSVFGLAVAAEDAAVSAEAIRLLIMAVVSTGVAVAISLVSRREAMAGLRAFYRRARPPGFWGPVAAAEDADPARPRRALAAGARSVVATAATVFCLLTAIGSLIAGSPPPTWFPWRGPWIVLVAAVGLAAIPLWWKHAFGREPRGEPRGD